MKVSERRASGIWKSSEKRKQGKTINKRTSKNIKDHFQTTCLFQSSMGKVSISQTISIPCFFVWCPAKSSSQKKKNSFRIRFDRQVRPPLLRPTEKAGRNVGWVSWTLSLFGSDPTLNPKTRFRNSLKQHELLRWTNGELGPEHLPELLILLRSNKQRGRLGFRTMDQVVRAVWSNDL